MNIEEIQDAALREVREHGLYGRADSPAEWNEALEGASAGEPILVKDPEEVRDDFYLVPLNPKNAMACRGVWVMLDVESLGMREASLLNDWKAAAFPDQDDVRRVSEETIKFPDGTVAKFRPDELKPNMKNLVWKASVATILPYWPVKELRAAHPVTGVSTPIYVSQEGGVYTSLSEREQNDAPETSPSQSESPLERKSEGGGALTKLLGVASVALAASTAYLAMKPEPEETDPAPLMEEITELKKQVEELEKSDSEKVGDLEGKVEELREEIQQAGKDRDDWKDRFEELEDEGRRMTDLLKAKDAEIEKGLGGIKQVEKDRDDWRRRFDELKNGEGKLAGLLKEELRKKEAEIAAARRESEQWKRSVGILLKERDGWKKKFEELLRKKDDRGGEGGELNDVVRKGLEAEMERLSAQIHHAPEGMDLRKIKARLAVLENLLGIKRPGG